MTTTVRASRGLPEPGTDPTGIELRLLWLRSQGLTNAMAGRAAKIKEDTVKTHMRRLFHRLGVHSSEQAISTCYQRRIEPFLVLDENPDGGDVPGELASQESALFWIRRNYFVPAEVGRRVVVDGKPGAITGAHGMHLLIHFDGAKKPVPAHPTWRVTYMAKESA